MARYGQARVLLASARCARLAGRAAFIRPGVAGIVTVIASSSAIIISIGVFSPVIATYRLEQTAPDRVARTLSAWSVSSSAITRPHRAVGLLAAVTSPRAGIGIAGALLLLTPLLLPRHQRRTYRPYSNSILPGWPAVLRSARERR